MGVYRSERGRRVLRQWYEDAVDALSVELTERTVDTRHGETHLLLAGHEDAPPVLVFQGGNATNPMTLSWYEALADEYRLVAPDTIGQPGKSAETRVDPSGDGFGEWVVDLMDAVDADSAPMIGTSYGAGIVLRTAALAPERIERAALVVPAGFGTGSLSSMMGVGAPSLAYRFHASDFVLEHALAGLMTDPDTDPIARGTIAASLRHVELEREFPEADADELAHFDTPVALFLAEDDPFFPPRTIRRRARERLPNLASVTVLEGEKHILSADARERVTASIRDFFGE